MFCSLCITNKPVSQYDHSAETYLLIVICSFKFWENVNKWVHQILMFFCRSKYVKKNMNLLCIFTNLAKKVHILVTKRFYWKIILKNKSMLTNFILSKHVFWGFLTCNIYWSLFKTAFNTLTTASKSPP